MGFILQVVCAGFLASLFSALFPHVLSAVKPYAVRAAGGVTHQFFVGLCVGVMLGVFPALIGGMKLPSIADIIAWVTPDVTPDDDVTPAPVAGFRVVFIRETGAKMTTEQVDALNSSKIAAYLNEKCAKDDGQPGWRRYDPNQDVQYEPQAWQTLWDAVKPKATSLPCVAVVTGSKVVIHPVVNEADTLAILKKVGG